MSEKELLQETKAVNSASNEDEERFLGYMQAAALLATDHCDRSVEKMRDIFDANLSEYCRKFNSPINIKNVVIYIFKEPEDDNPAFHEMVVGAKLYSVRQFCRINNVYYLFNLYSYPETSLNDEENMAGKIDIETLDALMDAAKAEIGTGQSEEQFISCVKLASRTAFKDSKTNMISSCQVFIYLLRKLLMIYDFNINKLCTHVRCHSREDEYTYFSMLSRGYKYEMSCEYGGYSESYISYHAYLFN